MSRRPRTLMLAVATAALAITSIGAPGAAAPGKASVVFINGAPGRSADVCINGREVRSGLRHGQKLSRSVIAGKKNVRFHVRAPGNCRGALLGRRTVTFAPGGETTIVLTRRSPRKVVVFNRDLAPLAVPAAPPSIGIVRHAADVGPMYISWQLHNFVTAPVEPVSPALISPFLKGQSSETLLLYPTLPALMILATHPALAADEFIAPRVFPVKLFRRYEWVLVGTNARNARWVAFSRELIV